MDGGETSPTLERRPLSYVAQTHMYVAATDNKANPIIIERRLKLATRDNNARGWGSVSDILGRCFYPFAHVDNSARAFTLGNQIISKGLGWEYYDIEYIPIPTRYTEWSTEVLTHHSLNLKGDGESNDYIYGAIYCSLGQYSISPSLLKSLLERWNPATNTFLFQSGERTITLLDMHKIMGLPLEGEYYEEFIPHRHELDPSLLLYPSCLYQLLDIWADLQVGGEVSLQEWCDHFHNTPGGPPPADDKFSLVYKAAFIALWLCTYVIVAGGPRVRPGVLVMASWIAIGRRYALAQPALCSLYYSLRLICTHSVGPSSLKRPWPVHYVIGWMGVYIKFIFGDKKKINIPPYNHRLRRPMMVNTMSRTPKRFSPEEAYHFLCKDANILWCPYKPNRVNQPNIVSPPWASRTFCLAVRRGLLPFRRGNLCIVEPHHSDRVARQFKLDQDLPYSPLESVYTEENFGVAYAYWSHLLQPVQQDMQLIPNEDRTGGCTVYWLKWYKNFFEPFASISDSKGW